MLSYTLLHLLHHICYFFTSNNRILYIIINTLIIRYIIYILIIHIFSTSILTGCVTAAMINYRYSNVGHFAFFFPDGSRLLGDARRAECKLGKFNTINNTMINTPTKQDTKINPRTIITKLDTTIKKQVIYKRIRSIFVILFTRLDTDFLWIRVITLLQD